MIYDNRDNLQLYINRIKKHLKLPDNILIYSDDLEYCDDFKIGLIYRLINTKKQKLYFGSEEEARGERQKEHIISAFYKYNKKMNLTKLNRHIIEHKNELEIIVDEVYEIVVYKMIDKLYEREQYYIDLFDTIKNGLNSIKAKISDKIQNNNIRFNEYNKMNKFFRRYGKQLMNFKDKANDKLKLNLSFDYCKDIIEDNKMMIENFINLYCYNKQYETEQYNILYNYILYEQKKRKPKYFYEIFDKPNFEKQDFDKPDNQTNTNKPVNKNEFENLLYKQILNDKSVNENNIVNIEFVENNDIVNINVIDIVVDII